MATEKTVPKMTAARNASHRIGTMAMKTNTPPHNTTASRKTCALPRFTRSLTTASPIPMPAPHSAASQPNAASEPPSVFLT